MESNTFKREFRALGTDVCIWIVASESEASRAAIDMAGVENLYQEKEKIFSRFDAGSELSRLNGNLGKFCEASSDMAEIVGRSLEYNAKNRGMFDPRILGELERIGYEKDFKKNDFKKNIEKAGVSFESELAEDMVIEGGRVRFMVRMDFSGIAKGYITDRAADFLEKRGWGNFLVDSGGDMFARGKNKHGENWGIALEGTKDEDEIMAELMNEGLATSGRTRRHWKSGGRNFHHLINPKNKERFDFSLRSVTVVSSTAEEADVMAKILFILGPEEGASFAKENGLRAIFLKNDQGIIKVNL